MGSKRRTEVDYYLLINMMKQYNEDLDKLFKRYLQEYDSLCNVNVKETRGNCSIEGHIDNCDDVVEYIKTKETEISCDDFICADASSDGVDIKINGNVKAHIKDEESFECIKTKETEISCDDFICADASSDEVDIKINDEVKVHIEDEESFECIEIKETRENCYFEGRIDNCDDPDDLLDIMNMIKQQDEETNKKYENIFKELKEIRREFIGNEECVKGDLNEVVPENEDLSNLLNIKLKEKRENSDFQERYDGSEYTETYGNSFEIDEIVEMPEWSIKIGEVEEVNLQSSKLPWPPRLEKSSKIRLLYDRIMIKSTENYNYWGVRCLKNGKKINIKRVKTKKCLRPRVILFRSKNGDIRNYLRGMVKKKYVSS